MIDLRCSFAGLALANPIIISSCGLTSRAENNAAFESAGAAAVVIKSLFEESIVRESDMLLHGAEHGEASDYLQGYMRVERLREYLDVIKCSKQLCSIPIIASIAARSADEWVAFAEAIEQVGADALELNIMSLASSRNYLYGSYEQMHIDILSAVKRCCHIPIIVKLGANLTNPLSLANSLKGHGADGVVMFNRPYQIDIDIEKMAFSSAKVISHCGDLVNPLRWVTLTSSAIKTLPLALSGGVHNGVAVVKALLAGASAVEVCSAIYRDGNVWIRTALEYVEEWCRRHDFDSVEEFRGHLSVTDAERVDHLERMQFMRYFGSWK